MNPTDIFFIGVGNPHRRDDGVGPWVAKRLKQKNPHWRVQVARADATALVDLFDRESLVVLVDAMKNGQKPGACLFLDGLKDDLGALDGITSSHALGVSEAVALAQVLGRLPKRLFIWAFEAGDLSFGEGLSKPVEDAARAWLSRVNQNPASALDGSAKV
jgi:hydrogenase maturation protease